MRSPSPGLVLGMAALFLSLGGVGAAATGLFSGGQIANHTIPLSKLTPGAVRALRTGTDRPDTVDAKAIIRSIVAQVRMNGGLAMSSGGVTSRRMAPGRYVVSVASDIFKEGEAGSLTALATPLVAPASDPYLCEVSSAASTKTGSAKVGVACFSFTSGRTEPADTAFSVEIDGLASSSAGASGKALNAYIKLPGRVAADGAIAAGSGFKSKRMAPGSYLLTVPAGTYKEGEAGGPLAALATAVYSAPNTDQGFCQITSAQIAKTGAASVRVACFLFKSGRMQPADAEFSFDIEGPPPVTK